MHESPIRMPFALQYRFTYPRQILFKMIWTNMKVGIEAIPIAMKNQIDRSEDPIVVKVFIFTFL